MLDLLRRLTVHEQDNTKQLPIPFASKGRKLLKKYQKFN